VCEHVDDRAPRVFDEEAADTPRLVGERVGDSQSASDGLGMRGVDCRGFTDVAVVRIRRPSMRRRTALAWNEAATSPAGRAFLELANRRFNTERNG
jgi:hypothetical protein